jgi:hypothetical protein
MKELLRALAENDRDREAPATVEMRLSAAFRRKYQRRAWPYVAAFALAAAAAIMLSINVKPKPQTMEIAVVPPPVVVIPVAKVARRKVVYRRPPPVEVVSEFYPLMDAAPPFERGELLRVSLPASAMRNVGLPVSEDRLTEMVQADVLVGEEGLARAIRFVRFER